jgi:hypothetical protein
VWWRGYGAGPHMSVPKRLGQAMGGTGGLQVEAGTVLTGGGT